MNSKANNERVKRIIFSGIGLFFIAIGLVFNPWIAGELIGNDKLIRSGQDPARIKLVVAILNMIWIGIGIGVLTLRQKFKFIEPLAFICFSLLTMFVLIETATYFFLGLQMIPSMNSSWTAINKDCARFDPNIGYRWNPGTCRITRVISNELIFDQTFKINNQGYVSKYNYKETKPAGTHRIIVFGDSFTAGIFLPSPWPDILQEKLNSVGGNCPNYEVFNFGVDAGGLPNWHQIFTKEVLPHFEFDTAIISYLYDNLRRPNMIFHTSEESLLMAYSDKPINSEEEFLNHVRPKMFIGYDRLPDDEIDKKIDQTLNPPTFFWPNLDLHFSRWIWRKIRGANEMRQVLKKWAERYSFLDTPESEKSGVIPIENIEKAYGKKTFSYLREILDTIKSKGKTGVISTVPMREKIVELNEEETYIKGIHRREGQSIAKHFNLSYFDGYAVFDGISKEEIYEKYWLKYDGHWDTPGAELYAEKLAQKITADCRAAAK